MKNNFDFLFLSACLDIRHLILISNERWTLIFEKVITAPAQIPQMHFDCCFCFFDFVFVFSVTKILFTTTCQVSTAQAEALHVEMRANETLYSSRWSRWKRSFKRGLDIRIMVNIQGFGRYWYRTCSGFSCDESSCDGYFGGRDGCASLFCIQRFCPHPHAVSSNNSIHILRPPVQSYRTCIQSRWRILWLWPFSLESSRKSLLVHFSLGFRLFWWPHSISSIS